MRSHMLALSIALTAIVLSATSLLAAAIVPAPEIDGGSIATGLGVLTAGVLMIRARRR